MINLNSRIFLAGLLLFGVLLTPGNLNAQLSGPKSIPGDYATVAAFVTDLNLQGVGPGGVTANVMTGHTETAPAGGILITATGTLADPIIIQGVGGMPKPLITASGSLTAGNLNDGIIVLQGADFVTIDGLQLQENAANLTTTAGTNNMTEWGIALLYATTTNGSQNVTIQNNTISLNKIYQNTFGIYSNSSHTLGSVTASASATSPAGNNSGLKIYSNSISNSNQGIVVVGPTTSANYNNGIDIGGSSLLTANTITNYGTTGTFSAYANVSLSVFGILVRNSVNFNISNNSITSSVGGTTSGALRGIFVPSFSTTPSGTFSNAVNNNSIDIRSGAAAGAMDAIIVQGTSATATSSITVDNNTVNGLMHTVAGTAGITFITMTSPAFSASVSNNTFNVATQNTTGSVTFLSCSYTTPAGGSQNINNNTLVGAYSKTGAGSSVTVYTTSGSSLAGTTLTATGNNFSNITVAGGTTLTGWNNGDGSTTGGTKTISNNTFSNWTAGTGAITVMSQNYGGNACSVTNNTISNINGQGNITGINLGANNKGTTQSCTNNSINGLTSSGAGGNVVGITNSASTTSTMDISGNSISNLSSTLATGSVTGITVSATNTVNVFQNTIDGLAASGATPSVTGITTTGGAGAINVYKNKVTNLSVSGAVTNTAINGIAALGGTTVNIYNNVIGALTAPNGNATNVINGISVNSATNPGNNRIYHNTIYLNASSVGATFGTTGVFHTNSATPSMGGMDLRNNIIINESVAQGAGLTVAHRRSGAGNGNYNGLSNRNLFYAGVPSASNLISYDGTTSLQTLAAFQAAVTPRESASITGEAFTYGLAGSFFISLTPSNADYLKPVTAAPTFVESGASVITTPAITDDYASVIRGGNTGYTGTGMNPDMGAFEFNGSALTPVTTLNSVTPGTTAQCTVSARLISVNIATSSGTISDATLNYSFNGVPQTPLVMVNTVGTTWEATIPAASPVNATVTWNIVANSTVPLSSTYTGTTYADEPTLGYTAVASATQTTLCAGEDTDLSVKLSFVSTPPSYVTPPAVTNPTFDEDFSNVTIAQGATTILNNTTPINSLVGSIGTASGTAGSYSDFTSFGPYELSKGQLYDLSVSSVQQGGGYSNAFGVYIDYNKNGVFTDAGEAVYISPSTVAGDHTDMSTFTVPSTAATGLVRMRVINNEGLVSSPTMTVSYGEYEEYLIDIMPGTTAVSWSDGVGTVGTATPLNVTPTGTTDYTGTLTLFGCPVTAAPLTINVNPLPTDPTMTPSTQCGVQIPAAAATSTSGLPTPTFNWYDAPVGGTLLQSSTSAVYTSPVTTTTTFYVSELNTATGCESGRVSVVVTVIIPDSITASVVLTPVCEGESISLDVVNDNPVPVQNYTYSWSGPVGSGAEGGLSGASISVTPTVPGSYSYQVSGIDGICTAIDNIGAVVNPIPGGVTASASVSVTCDGAAFDLFSSPTGSPVSLYSENFDAGIGGWTTINAVSSPAVSNWAPEPAPFTFTTGSNDFTNFTTVQGGNFMLSHADAGGSGSYTDTELISPVFSTDGMISADITFEHLYYKWSSGDDFVRIEISTDGMTWAVLEDYLAPGTQGITTANAQATTNELIALPALYLDQPTVQVKFVYKSDWGYYWIMDDFDVTGTPEPLIYDWTSSPAGFTSSVEDPTGVVPAGTADYIVKVTNSFGCEASAVTTVAVAVSTVSTVNVTNCIDYTLNAQTYSTSGVYTQNLMNVAGCDSTLTLNLTITQPSDSTITATTCGEYVLNSATYTTSGTYLQVIPNVYGCDSTITLDLTITPESGTSLNVNACNSYTHDGNTFTTSGIYTIPYIGVNSCDSIVTIDLTINGPAVATNTGNGILTASSGLSYQWLRCPTMDVIPGATFQTYMAPANGDYAVVVDNGGGCVDTSDCETVSNVSISEVAGAAIRIYPNPTNGELNIMISEATAVVEVLDAQGKLVDMVTIEEVGMIDMTAFERGVYYIRIKTDAGISMHKVVKS